MTSYDGLVGEFDGEDRSVRTGLGDPGLGDAGPQASYTLDRLLHAIEGEIIPRLLAAHGQRRRPATAAEEPLGDAHVDELTRIVIARGPEAALSYARSIEAAGTPISSIYLHVLAPVARKLGRMWETDECGFAEVTLGLCHLHHVMRSLSASMAEQDAVAKQRSVLLLPAPGEQHMFGVLMVADFFRRAGWEVTTGPAESVSRLVQMVRAEHYDLVGLSISTKAAYTALPRQLDELRRASRNPRIGVLVGGQVFTEHPELAEGTGADGTGVNAPAATLWAERFLAG